jgi:hypothetical protein
MGETGYKPRFGKDIRIRPDSPPRPQQTRPCEAPGCAGEGGYRVPKSRERLDEHLWFCLEHARAHNQHWDYFSGMKEPEIEAFRNDAITGHRPTWPLGRRAAAHPRREHVIRELRDSMGIFGEASSASRPRPPERALTPLQARSLDVLGLEAGASLHQIKARYKELVKRYHPDANGGDRGAEERLKRVIQAYGVLRASGLT